MGLARTAPESVNRWISGARTNIHDIAIAATSYNLTDIIERGLIAKFQVGSHTAHASVTFDITPKFGGSRWR